MKTLLIILGFSLYGTTGAAFQVAPCCGQPGIETDTVAVAEIYPDFEASLLEQGQAEQVDASSIQVVQIEEEAALGFDSAAFLPEGFDAYAGKIATWVDLNLIEVEEEPEPDLGFDTAPYLPAGFDPYSGMKPAWERISTEAIQAMLYHAGRMPACEVPLCGMHPGNSVGLEVLGLIEVAEEETDLGFDTAAYLPAGFDPYLGMGAERSPLQ